jgi:hypothetical protein
VPRGLSYAAIYAESVFLGRGPHAQPRSMPGTGFIVGHPHDLIFVTAGHVLSGLDGSTGKVLDEVGGARPDVLRLRLAVPSEASPAAERTLDIPLYTDEEWEQPLYYKHPAQAVDVAAIRLPFEFGPELVMPFDVQHRIKEADFDARQEPDAVARDASRDLPLFVAERLFIIGFPFGDTGTWPAAIWSTGYVASEPQASYRGRPAFLVDSRTRPGQSGSPVVRHITPEIPVRVGEDVVFHEQTFTELVGVYSGRIDPGSDLGIVYTAEAIEQVLDLFPPKIYTDDE